MKVVHVVVVLNTKNVVKINKMAKKKEIKEETIAQKALRLLSEVPKDNFITGDFTDKNLKLDKFIFKPDFVNLLKGKFEPFLPSVSTIYGVPFEISEEEGWDVVVYAEGRSVNYFNFKQKPLFDEHEILMNCLDKAKVKRAIKKLPKEWELPENKLLEVDLWQMQLQNLEMRVIQ